MNPVAWIIRIAEISDINISTTANQLDVSGRAAMFSGKRSKVFVVKTEDRSRGIRTLLDHFDMRDFKGKTVALKANFNSADRFPASTHPDTVAILVKSLKKAGAKKITLAERSGMGVTGEVLRDLGIMDLSRSLGFDVNILDQVPEEGWVRVRRPDNHWKRGFLLAKIFHEANSIVQTCCLKTHRFGGHFTLSLKNSVGMVAKFDPKDGYGYMNELHSSPFQRLMIAEINREYNSSLVIMDGIEAFVSGGPDRGQLVRPCVILAGEDRVALDAVGVGILRLFGTTPEVAEGDIFEQEQIARAVELGVGAKSFDEVEIVPLDWLAEGFVKKLEGVLARS